MPLLSVWSKAVRISTKSMHAFAEFFHFVPFKYKCGKDEPDSIALITNLTFYKAFAFFSVLVQILFIIYLYFEAFFGEVSNIEFFFIIGINAAFTVINICEWHFVLFFSRNRVVAMMNHVLVDRFKNSYHPTLVFEFIYMALSNCTITYPPLLLPCLIFVSLYLPGMFRGLHTVTRILTAALGYDEAETAPLVQFVLLVSALALVSLALGHGIVNLIILALWLLTHHVSTIQSLKILMESKGKW